MTVPRRLPLAFALMLVLSALAVHAQEATPAAPWWRDRVFYEIYVRAFYDSDGDGIGDFDGLTSKLDYLNDGDPATTDDLGITGIWLMPIMEGPTTHGYHVSDYRSIERDYGTEADFREFMAAARERGIAVIVDLMLNHVAQEHEWFREARDPASDRHDWFIWADEDPGYTGPWGQDVWHPLDGRYYYGIFNSSIPDLNVANPEVTAELYDVARFWLEDMGVDGFRLDAVKHLIEDGATQENTPATLGWLAGFDAHVTDVRADALTVGELFGDPLTTIAQYVDDEVDMAFNFPLAAGMIDSADVRGNSSVVREQRASFQTFPEGNYAAFLTNHDQNRVMYELGHDLGKAKVAAALLLTGHGVPFLYYGEEIGMTGAKPDPRIRTPMQWDSTPNKAGFTSGRPFEPLQANIRQVNVALETADPDSLLSEYRRLIHLRNATPALREGDWTLVDAGSRDLYAFLRRTPDQTVLVVINLEDEPVAEYALALDGAGLPDGLAATPLFGADVVESPDIAGGGFAGYRPVESLPPQSTLVIELSE